MEGDFSGSSAWPALPAPSALRVSHPGRVMMKTVTAEAIATMRSGTPTETSGLSTRHRMTVTESAIPGQSVSSAARFARFGIPPPYRKPTT